MEIYAILSMFASIICIGLGLGIYFLNRNSLINKLFTALMFANAYWAICEFMLVRAPNLQTAEFWNKALFLWPFIISVALHFTLVFTENGILKKKAVYLLIYLPALFFSVTDLTTNWISTTPALMFWGYVASYPSYSLLSSLYSIWAAAASLVNLLLFAQYYFRLTDETKKQQTKSVTAGFAIPICLSIVTDSLLPVLGIDFPVMGSIAVSFTAFIVAFAVVKYELFGLNLEMAAENVFSTMPDAVALVDLQGVIVKVNNALLTVTGYKEDEVVGKSIKHVVAKAKVLDKGNETPQIIEHLHRKKEIKNYEITFESKFGQKKFGNLSCSMVLNNQGQNVGIVFVLHDITEQKEMSRKLLDSQRLASIGELAGIIGHDLRNPLTGIRGAAYYLKSKYAMVLDDKDKAMFETIDKSIDYSNKIVTDLVDYSSNIVLELEKSSSAEIVQNALDQTLKPANIQVIHGAAENVPLTVDTQKICRGFANIIKNAYDAMPNGGTLIIDAKTVEQKIIFNFTDTGYGMTTETLSKLWLPLYTTKAKGMGFGLAICRRVVEAHGGKIWAESKLKKGTIVTVELPLGLESPEPAFDKLLQGT